MKKYNINNFYVGKLTFLSRFGNLAVPSQYQEERLNKRYELLETIKNGAIDLRNLFYRGEYIDYNTRCYYDSMYTIFYKEDNEYYCLHNGKIYSNKRNDRYDFCENLVPFKEILPKYSYNIPSKLSLREAGYLFNIIYSKKNMPFTKEPFNLNDFYYGTLDLCSSITEENTREKLCNLEKYLRLCKLGLFTHSRYCLLREKNDQMGMRVYDYSIFKSIFYKVGESKFYNIHDFNTYDKDVTLKYPMAKIGIQNSLKEILKENDINYKKEDITMPKVLKLTKKII